jgi:L-threonylcarbamoyladenylate synthase
MPQVSFDELVAGVCTGHNLASFPTDTVPALAVWPDHAHLLFTAKQRSLDKPLILMGADAADLWPYVVGTPAAQAIWQQVADRHWPGALTLVLPASDRVPVALNPKNPTTIGIRIPNYAIARAILAKTGPLATTSANLSGQPALQTITEIEAQFPQILTLAPDVRDRLDQGSSRSPNHPPTGIPSTVIRWDGQQWELLRQGGIPFAEI